MKSAGIPPSSEHSKRLQSALERAAICGPFDPRKLLGIEGKPEPADQALLRDLGEVCTEVEHEGGFRWQLRADQRHSVLSSLKDSDRLRDVAESSRPEPDDEFGRLLAEVVLQREVDADGLDDESLERLRVVTQFVAPVAEPSVRPAQVEILQARRAVESALDVVLPVRLVGRVSELEDLKSYVVGATEDERSGRRAPVPMQITGIGGSGKSALLAELFRRHQQPDWKGIPFILIDFDRASFASADPVVMFLELARQLALYRPELADGLGVFIRDVQADIRALTTGYEGAGSSDFHQSSSTLSFAFSAWNTALQDSLPIREPVVLILDTFEEIAARGESERGFVETWLGNLYGEAKIYGLRPILSGRALSADPEAIAVEPDAPQILLADLAPSEAERLLGLYLSKTGLKPKRFPVRKLVTTFGGNPLVLKILARVLEEEGEKAAQDLLSDGPTTGYEKKVGQQFLYRRILKRMRADDPDIEKLAHPGLVLRRVTPDLIEKVLAGPCKLRDMSAARARELFAKLSHQVWLVERTGHPDVILHRRDLRRLMLRLVTAAEQETTDTIHAGAASYYRAHRDPYLSETDQDAEATFHGLFSANPELPADARAFVARFGEDIENVPIAVRARLKLEAGRPLAPEEVESLDARNRERHDRQLSRSTASRGGRRGSESLESVVNRSALDPTTAAREAIQYGDLEATCRIAPLVVEQFLAELRDVPAPGEESFIDSPLWQATMTTFGRPEGRVIAERLLASFQSSPASPPAYYRGSRDGISVQTALRMLLHLVYGPDARRLGPPEAFHSSRTDSSTAIRALQLQATMLIRPMQIARGLLADLNPAYPDAVRGLLFDEQALAEIGRPGSSRLSLSKVHALRKRRRYVTLSILAPANETRRAIRPMLREVYPLATAVLRARGEATLLDFASQMEELVPLWPRELRPEYLAASLQRDRRRWLATLVEFCDCSGRLLDLLRFCQESPQDPIARLASICEEYERQLMSLVCER